MNTGTVKVFGAKRGFGFITDDATKEDYFVHFSGINMDGYRVLNKGEKVTFDVIQTEKGPQAVNVTKVEA